MCKYGKKSLLQNTVLTICTISKCSQFKKQFGNWKPYIKIKTFLFLQ